MNFMQEQGLAKSRSIWGLLTTAGCLLTEMTQTGSIVLQLFTGMTTASGNIHKVKYL